MILFLWFTLFWKALVVGAAIPLLMHFYSVVKQARQERKEEASYREISTPKKVVTPKLVMTENTDVKEETQVVVVEATRTNPVKLSQSEVTYVAEDEREACIRRKQVKTTGPPDVA